jgi:hypothetical protein
MVISVVRHQLALLIGPVGYLFHPAFGFFIGVFVARLPLQYGRTSWFNACLILYALGLTASGIFTSSEWFYILSTVLLGPALMGFVLITFNDSEFRQNAIKAFCLGMVLWSVAFLALYSFTVASAFKLEPAWMQFPLDKLVMAMRMPGDTYDFFMFKISGNFNKQSNLLVITMLLASYLLMVGQLSFRTWSICLVPILTVLVLMFSRGAISVLVLCGVAFAIIALFATDRHYLVVSCSMFVVFFVSISTPLFRSYWIDMSSLEQREIIATKAVIGDSDRFLRSGEVAVSPNGRDPLDPSVPNSDCVAEPPVRTLSFNIFGYGLGHFGPTICRFPEAESHNAFIDAWIQGGLIGFAGYIGLFIVGFFVGIRKIFRSSLKDVAAVFGTAIICATAVLALREFAFVYLWVQSAGGFLFTIGLSLVVVPVRYRKETGKKSLFIGT